MIRLLSIQLKRERKANLIITEKFNRNMVHLNKIYFYFHYYIFTLFLNVISNLLKDPVIFNPIYFPINKFK